MTSPNPSILRHIELYAGLRALVRTLAPDRPLLPGAARVVRAIQDHLGLDLDPDTLPPIGDAALAVDLVDPWLRQQLVRALVIGLLIDDVGTPADLARVEHVAFVLGVDEPALIDAKLMIAGKRWRLRRHVVARMWAIDHIKARIAERGFLRTIIPLIYSTFFGRYTNRALAAKYAALRDMPEGSLGRGYIAYVDANKFGLPGERGAVTDIIVPHDLAHVLGGYDTTPQDEVLVASFSAGHRVKDPFAFVMFVLFQFHLGVRMTPGAKAERGHFDPALVIEAIARGAAMTIDLTGTWDYWPDLAMPIETLRARYGIAPRTSDGLRRPSSASLYPSALRLVAG